MAYTTEEKVEAYLMINIDPSQSDNVDDWITAVTQWIENYTGRTFEAAVATKYYDGSGTRELDIDPVISITTLQTLNTDGTVDTALTEGHASDFLLFPLNESPKYTIKLVLSSSIGVFPKGMRRVKIVGNFGQTSTVPKNVELAASMLVGKIIKEGIKGGQSSAESLGDFSISYQKVDEAADSLGIKNILDQYRKIEI